ncbi:PAS domain-containing sensor histidine kinase [Candidatus Chloroploca sp. Khr17]|uniref:PAS domain-containing sensor histidine kinase n=1 Tax=Candidatus Chloroploca sp. Khr17 TaxID=2496869 RepID=UPI00101B78A2|nr:PAS domain-containing sensor histidine kinase [Candidatus Chloroploca sp. Khr17]
MNEQQNADADAETRFAAIFYHSPIGIVMTRIQDSVIVEVNAAWMKLIGYTREEALGRTAMELGLWEEPHDRQRLLDHLDARGRIDGFEATLRQKGGGQCHALISGEYLVLKHERFLVLQLVDLTARKQSELSLRESEERYRLLFATMVQGVIYLDLDGYIIDANPAAQRILGLTLDQMRGRTSRDPRWKAIYEDGTTFPGEAHPVSMALRTGQPVYNTVMGVYNPLIDKTNWIRINAIPLFKPGQNTLYQVYATFEDITERKVAEFALRASEEELRNLNQNLEALVRKRTAEVQDLYDRAPNGYHSLDAEGNILMINQTELAWLGYTHEELLGQHVSKIIAPHSLPTFQQAFPIFIAQGWIKDIELDFLRKNGTTFPVLISAIAIRDEAGYFVMSRTTIFDNTDRKKAEKIQLLANAEMARALRTKDEFLATMSHELRTPLNAILALSESMLEGLRGSLNDRQQEAIHHIEASGKHLLTLINDILDLSKVEAGRLDLQISPFPVIELCQASMQFVKEMARKKELTLHIEIREEDGKVQLAADPKRLKQVLVNLLSNAVKFTPSGGLVTLEAGVSADQTSFYFAVRDTGIGIQSEDMARLFQPFTQLDGGLTRQYDGTGLGLTLVRRLAELHGGTVTVESVVNQGSCFTVLLPYQP